MIDIKHNLALIEQQIFNACEKNTRNRTDISLLAVSKTKPCIMIEQAYQAGQRNFGENYVQEAVEKIISLTHLSEITWHFIGPIQSNKTKQIAQHFSWVHSLDRVKIAKRLNQERTDKKTPLNVCIQVNVSNEASKSGVSIDDLPALVEYVAQCKNLTLKGLMAIPEKNAAIESYQKMQQLFLQLKASHSTVDTLSMGMSNDLETAIHYGSTMVRVGSAIFGKRT